MYQTSKNKMWVDESGMEIPFSRTTKSERLRERSAHSLLSDAQKLNSQLAAFKEKVIRVCDEVYQVFMEEKNNEKARKGNFTWYNFDRSIKVEVAIQDRIEFDDLTISASKDKFDQYLHENVTSKDDFVKEIVVNAFSTSRGKLDTRKVLDLIKYKSRSKDPVFQEAIKLLEESIRRPDSKTYFRIWERDTQGQYHAIDLNFSSL